MGMSFEDLNEGQNRAPSHKKPHCDLMNSGGLPERFRRDTRGGVLVLVAIMFIPMMAFIGYAFELALTEDTRVKLQNTTDAASLAAADLEQTLDPEDLVEDFFAKAGLADNLDNVTVVSGIAERTVSIEASERLPAYLSRVVGNEAWDVAVAGAATESRQDLEIAVALDNSGSMSWAPGATSGPASTPSRMDLLIPAAQAFVDAVQPRPGQPGRTTISLVPFATQVSVGEALLGNFSVTAEHNLSHCVTFSDEVDYQTTAISTTDLLNRTAHHAPSTGARSVTSGTVACPTDSATRDIVPWSEDPEVLKARIRAMQPGGFTSIEMATKWGAALLDPTLRPVLSSLSTEPGFEYLSGPAVRGVPDEFTSDETVKYLIVMSDGENTQSYDVKPPFRTGNSPVVQVRGTNRFYYFQNRPRTRNDFFEISTARWVSRPNGTLVQLTWPEVWAQFPVYRFAELVLARVDRRRSAVGHYNRIIDQTVNTSKNPRTSAICQAAKDNGITIFTIGMDTYAQGDATLLDCASSPAFFYDVNSLDIDSAFQSIARQINRLRLTQ
ncbi:TadE/TadG family type IV pilus assembly protein [Ruegeria lacuscaerulensis]|uniref:TadE/TadG family type IV pilus assembly protein n=1 Tax=Ruegeria lacuscaerulensis TaxID=55218 RepID=UPI00147DE8AD|nr:pilus assembly protein TadG-related protein [Ruegeria lacuscaerulensis]